MPNSLNISEYIIPFFIAFTATVLFTNLIKQFAQKAKVVDNPELSPERKIQKKPTPLLGGLAIFLAVLAVTAFYALGTDRLLGGYMLPKYLWGILLGGLMLMIGGYLDDKFSLKPAQQIIWPILASAAVIASGIGIVYITNPLGGVLYLDAVKIQIFSLNGLPYYFTLFADLFAFLWLMGMMYTTKFLDGLDGLVSGITTIGAFVLFFLSLDKEVAQPETALLAIILAGACLGFLAFNFHPARIFLGEGGSLFTGFMLGVLAIISGAKIATALMIMGIPILDVAWVIGRRLFFEKRSPFKTADKKHLHFRLLDAGFSHRQAVLLLYLISILFGSVALFLSSAQKLIALIVVLMLMVALGVILVHRYRRKKTLV